MAATKAAKAKPPKAEKAEPKPKQAPEQTPEEKLAEMLRQQQTQTVPTIDLTPAKKVAARGSKFTMVIFGGLSSFPVKTFTAVDEDKVERHMYHGHVPVLDENKQPVMEDVIVDGKPTGEKRPKMSLCLGEMKQSKMRCAKCEAEADRNAIVKGVEIGGKIVLVSDEELKAQQPMSDKSMKLLEYVDMADINPIYYEDSEYVAPDAGGELPFKMLIEAMKRGNLVAKGVRVKGGREQYFIVAPFGQNGMIMHYLRAEYEVRDTNGIWQNVANITLDPAMVEMSVSLMVTNKKKFTAASEDKALSNARKLIAAKAAGVAAEMPTPEVVPAQVTDLKAALEAALKAAKASA